jgi:hypothetical protein
MTEPSPLVADLVARLSEDLREDFEERAAIIEFEAGQPREDAECSALLDVLRRHPGALLGVVVVHGLVAGTDRYVLSRDADRACAWLKAQGAANVGGYEFDFALDDCLGGLAELVSV